MLKGSLIYSGGEGSAKAMLRKGKEMSLEYAQELNVGRTFKAERMACAKILGQECGMLEKRKASGIQGEGAALCMMRPERWGGTRS